MFLVYLDLDELPIALDRLPLWSARRFAPACFRRSDYMGDPQRPLREVVSDKVEEATGERPLGPIRMLTHLRYFGHCFNPVTFYYCFDPDGVNVESIVAEIENTPWKERHAYVLGKHNARPRSHEGRRGRVHRFRLRKEFHVSPFQDIHLDYDWRFRDPDGRIAVHMVTIEEGVRSFDATLSLRRKPMTGRNGLLFLAKYPLLTLRILVAIYVQALVLRIKGFRFYSHPSKRIPKEALSP